MPTVAPVYSVIWHPEGKQLASCSLDRSIKLWDAASGNLVREFKGYKEKEFENLLEGSFGEHLVFRLAEGEYVPALGVSIDAELLTQLIGLMSTQS